MNEIKTIDDEITRKEEVLTKLGLPQAIIKAVLYPEEDTAGNNGLTSDQPLATKEKYTPLSDAEFDQISRFLPDAAQARTSLRDFMDAVLWMLANRKPWTGIPAHYGDPNAIRLRASRMASKANGLSALADNVRGTMSEDRQKELNRLSEFAVMLSARRERAQKAARYTS